VRLLETLVCGDRRRQARSSYAYYTYRARRKRER
jgi:hypothetical protein